MEQIIEIARVMRDRSCARKLKGTVKEILGTCVSVGCTVDHEDPRKVQSKVSFVALLTADFGLCATRSPLSCLRAAAQHVLWRRCALHGARCVMATVLVVSVPGATFNAGHASVWA